MNLAGLKTQVLSKLEPLTSAPTYNAIHDDQWQRWANEKIPVVISALLKAQRLDALQKLLTPDTSITLTSGIGTLPSDFFLKSSLTIGTSRLQVLLLNEPDDFWRWDSSNFITTPRSERPIGIIMNDKVYVKPTTLSGPAYLTYIKNHPALTGSQVTLFNEEGDEPFIELVFQQALDALELEEE